jgi:hypothetical protein
LHCAVISPHFRPKLQRDLRRGVGDRADSGLPERGVAGAHIEATKSARANSLCGGEIVPALGARTWNEFCEAVAWERPV